MTGGRERATKTSIGRRERANRKCSGPHEVHPHVWTIPTLQAVKQKSQPTKSAPRTRRGEG
jgi:hypothetical protein